MEIDAYLLGQTVGFACDVKPAEVERRAFAVMCALDEATMEIHPATPVRLAASGKSLSGLLAAMKARRSALGSYWTDPQVGAVVPKGQLTSLRAAREAFTTSGIDLAHQFEFLGVCPPPAQGVKVEFLVKASSDFMMSAWEAPNVGLAPVAEEIDDLAFKAFDRGGRAYLEARPTDAANLGNRLVDAVMVLLDGGAHVVVLPELVATVGAIDKLKLQLRARKPSGRGALVVAGSGLSAAHCPTLNIPFNEGVVMSESGEVLFTQHKINPFNMGSSRMGQCGLPFATGHMGQPHMEDIAPGTVLTICDLPDLGRVMMLICEDLEQAHPGGDLAMSLRPDWIFTPVLDINQTLGRWPHNRAREIGRRTGTRFVVSCSATLSVRAGKKAKLRELAEAETGVGILYDGHSCRVHRVAADLSGIAPNRVITEWRAAYWERDHLSGGP